MWVLTGGGLFKYDDKSDSFITYPPLGKNNAPYTMCQDQSGNYWIGTWGEGLWQFFPQKKERNVIKGIILSIPEVGKRNRSFIV